MIYYNKKGKEGGNRRERNTLHYNQLRFFPWRVVIPVSQCLAYNCYSLMIRTNDWREKKQQPKAQITRCPS